MIHKTLPYLTCSNSLKVAQTWGSTMDLATLALNIQLIFL